MFYIKEIIFRLNYLIFSFFITTILCWCNRDLLLFILTFNILRSNAGSNITGIDYFIYTHPSELFTTYFSVILYFTFIFLLPQLLWHCLDFLKSSLNNSEHSNVLFWVSRSLFSLYISNVLCFVFTFPSCWILFESFNQNSQPNITLAFFLELKIQDYVLFLRDFLYNTNICLILFIILHLILNFYGLKKILYWKNSFLLINLLFATLLSPPDIYSQLFNTVLLNTLIETITLKHVFESKCSKYLTIALRHRVKINQKTKNNPKF